LDLKLHHPANPQLTPQLLTMHHDAPQTVENAKKPPLVEDLFSMDCALVQVTSLVALVEILSPLIWTRWKNLNLNYNKFAMD
jgi:hypothetical protein